MLEKFKYKEPLQKFPKNNFIFSLIISIYIYIIIKYKNKKMLKQNKQRRMDEDFSENRIFIF